jgi:hypothetical protein
MGDLHQLCLYDDNHLPHRPVRRRPSAISDDFGSCISNIFHSCCNVDRTVRTSKKHRLTVSKTMTSRRYSKIRLPDATQVAPKTGAALKRVLPAILKVNYRNAAGAAQRRAARLSKLAEMATTSPKLKEKYITQAREAAEVAEEMLRRSAEIE